MTCSVIIINYNTAVLTLKAIKSVITQTQNNALELIIVDNASKKEDYHQLKSGISEFTFSNIKLIRNRINTGFGGGNMTGIQHASGEYYVFLNSDAFLQEDSISIMVDFLLKNPDAGIIGATSIDENGKAYKAFDHKLSLRKELFGDQFMTWINPKVYPSRKKKLIQATKVGAVPGSFFICRALDFDHLGGFDTNLFLYYEEKDLAYRMEKVLKKGSYSTPETTYLHLKGQSTTPSYEIKKELRISQFYCIRKNLGMGKYIVFFLSKVLKFALKAPFSKKNRKYFMFLIGGASLAGSLKHKQKILLLEE